MPEFTVNDVRAWLDDPITQEFFGLVKLQMDDADKCTHKCLEENQLQEAALHNAGMAKLKDVLELPELLIQNIKEQDETQTEGR